ncbi:MAG: hypothetical protein EAX96_08820 [Candidatus Lokiarchaeota archaeon]|nr:hypothetical protein [Candidatus Lokiarchaeota archaeon]
MFEYIQHVQENVTFMIPMQLSTLTLTSKAGTLVGWSNLLCENIIYNDSNDNGIFDAGSSTAGLSTLPSLYFSDEFYGMMMPYACDVDLEMSLLFKNNQTPYPGYPITQNFKTPEDIDIPSLVDNFMFQWDTPTTTSNDLLEFSWNQFADDLPTMIQSMGMGGLQITEDMETDYNYANKLILNKSGEVKIETTNSFGEVANNTVKSTLDNMSLAVPYYSAFFAPGKINDSKTKHIPSMANKWQFKLADQLIGEAEFDNPFKENYTLVDYPSAGNNLTCRSIGSSVAKVLVEVGSNPMSTLSGSNPFTSILYDNNFYTLPSTYNITICYELVNYPTWSGHRIVHDPVFTVHTSPMTAPTVGSPVIPGFELLFVLVALPIIILIYYRKKNLYKENLI